MSGARYISHRCGHCGDCLDRPRHRPNPKHKAKEKVLDRARAAILALDDPQMPSHADDFLVPSANHLKVLTAESLATFIDAGLAATQWALHRLNLEGIVEQPTNDPPHDSTRDRWTMGCGGDHAWMASRYRVIPVGERKPRRKT